MSKRLLLGLLDLTFPNYSREIRLCVEYLTYKDSTGMTSTRQRKRKPAYKYGSKRVHPYKVMAVC